jgi:hypothetical protein
MADEAVSFDPMAERGPRDPKGAEEASFDPMAELGRMRTFDVHLGPAAGPASDEGPAPDDPDVLDLGQRPDFEYYSREVPGETRVPVTVKELGPRKEIPRNADGLIIPEADPRFPESENPVACETMEVAGHTIYKIGEKQWYSPGKPYHGPSCARRLRDLLDHYDTLMRVSTPRTAAREEEAKTGADTKPGGKNYDPLYDYSLYGREDHPRWLQFCREEKMRDEAEAKGLIPPGTVDFDGMDRYGKDDPFIFNGYRQEEYDAFYERYPFLYQRGDWTHFEPEDMVEVKHSPGFKSFEEGPLEKDSKKAKKKQGWFARAPAPAPAPVPESPVKRLNELNLDDDID